jgi:CubicO group peptidase (beta-lactamase class C family)
MHRLALFPLVAMIATPAAADPAARDRIRAVISDRAGTAAPGCAVGVFRAGKPAELVNAGGADIATGRAINTDTQFYAASVSKQFTAIALMQQVAAGKVALDDDIRKYLPELPDYGHKITPVMLLNHTAGIRDSLALLALAGYSDLAAATRAQGLALTLQQTTTKFTPGTRYDYSNGGYLLLSEIVERVAKEPFHAYVNRLVLKPLGMSRSLVLAGNRTADANHARGYHTEDGRTVLADNYPLFGGSGGLITTINDLGKWDRDIDSGHKVWTAEITRLMTVPGKFTNGSPVVRGSRGVQYGNALLIGPHWFYHTGGATGFKTLYGRNPEKRVGIALLCNSGDIEPALKVDAVIQALGEGLPLVTEPSVAASAIDGRYRTADLDAVYLLAASGEGLDVTVLPEGGGTTPRRVVKLARDDDGRFKAAGLSIVPDDDARGFMLETSRVTLHFDRMP